jgi:hypothetical protein
VAAERQDAAVVTLVDDLEGGLVAAPDLVDEALVAERLEDLPGVRQASAASARQRGDFHR